MMYLTPISQTRRRRSLGYSPQRSFRYRYERCEAEGSRLGQMRTNGGGGGRPVLDLPPWFYSWRYRFGPYKIPPPSAPTAGPAPSTLVPVPANFPTNQFFVSSDGSVWEYSASQGRWINTGTPYSVGAGPATPGPTTTTAITAAAEPVPAALPAPAAAAPAPPSGYQAILDWLGQSSLVSWLPNWGLVLGAGVLLAVIKGRGR